MAACAGARPALAYLASTANSMTDHLRRVEMGAPPHEWVDPLAATIDAFLERCGARDHGDRMAPGSYHSLRAELGPFTLLKGRSAPRELVWVARRLARKLQFILANSEEIGGDATRERYEAELGEILSKIEDWEAPARY